MTAFWTRELQRYILKSVSEEPFAHPLERQRSEAPDPDLALVRGREQVRLGQRKGRDSPLVLPERAHPCVPERGVGDVPNLLA